MVSLAFKNGAAAGGFFSKAIVWKTGGPYSHVEMALTGPNENRLCFSSREPSGTGYTYINISDRSLWSVIDLDLTIAQEMQLHSFCDGCGKKEYDWWGILGFVLPWGEHDDHDRFCSEICTEALQKVLGWFPDLKPWKTSPSALHDLLIARQKA